MTIKELGTLYWLNHNIPRELQRITELEAEASAPSAVKYTGMPHSSTGYHESKLERNVVRIQERKEHLERMIQQRNRLEQFIDNVPDAFIRYVLTLRFIENMSWKEVAYTAGAGNTEDSVKKAVLPLSERK
ncbi:hypothetical protein [Agathobacter sp.]